MSRPANGRLFEWSMSVAMILLAFEIYAWPKTLEFSAFRDLLTVMTHEFVAFFMAVIGMLRITALSMNGYTVHGVRVGPVMRAVMAVFSSLMWWQFAYALLQLSVAQGHPSPGLPFWTTFIFGELCVAYRAVRGDGRNH